MAKNINEKIERFASALEERLGDNLLAFLLYGPAVRHDAGDTGALTTLLIVQDASPSALRPAGAPIAGWTKKGDPPPLIFSDSEWRSSSDVFPIEIEEMRDANRLLRGKDPLDGVETNKEDLRQELEREARGKLLQIRTQFAAVAADGKALGNLLTSSIVTFFILFRAVLRLTGHTPPREPRALIAKTSDVTGLDAEAFEWVLKKLSGDKPSNLKAYDAIGDNFVMQIEILARFVDSFEATSTEGVPDGGNDQ